MRTNHNNSSPKEKKTFYTWLICTAMALGGVAAINACLDQTGSNPDMPQAEQAQNSPSISGENTTNTAQVASGSTKPDSDASGTSGNETASEAAISSTSSDSGSENDSRSVAPDEAGASEKKPSVTSDETEETAAVMKNKNAGSVSFRESDGLSWPVSGEILLNYSTDANIYYKTLGQYRTNPAIVISARTGTDVLSAAAGTVTSIKKDDMTGTTVTVDIGNHYTLVYGQLDHLNIKEGDQLKKGEVIGTVAKPTNYYVVEGSNLYFAVQKKNKSVNPLLLLDEAE